MGKNVKTKPYMTRVCLRSVLKQHQKTRFVELSTLLQTRETNTTFPNCQANGLSSLRGLGIESIYLDSGCAQHRAMKEGQVSELSWSETEKQSKTGQGGRTPRTVSKDSLHTERPYGGQIRGSQYLDEGLHIAIKEFMIKNGARSRLPHSPGFRRKSGGPDGEGG
jgi:hypothetical protein